MKNEFITAITALAAEKNLPRDVVLEAVETALASAYKKDDLAHSNVVVKINADDGSMAVFTQKVVVQSDDDIEDDEIEIALDVARRYRPDIQVGEAINFEAAPKNAGRIAAQTAKQVVLQRLREAEREIVYDEYAGKEGEIVSGVVQRLEGRNVIIEMGKTEAVLPPPEQARTEHYRPGQRVKVMLLEVNKASKGPQIVVSRTHRDLLRRLFELEVPEIFKGVVEIKSIAREAGYRSKVAVWSRQEGVDPVGACVGMRGIRIQNVVNELNGERIDVVQWDPEPTRFVANALSPAQVVNVWAQDENTAEVVVPDRQLSLAIGKEGQNARLAAKLTGWRIDIKSQSAYEQELAEKGMTLEQAQAAAREEALARSKAAAASLAEEARAAAETRARPLTPEEEIALQYARQAEAEREEEPIEETPAAAAAAFEEATATEPPAPAAPSGKPVIRFAEELVREPLDIGAPQKKRGGPPGRRDDEERARQAALRAKKKGGARRILPEEEDEGDEGDESADPIM